MAKGESCIIPACSIITRYGDICDNHRWRFKKYESYDLPDRTIVKICKAPDCDRPIDKKQNSRLCVMHRVRWSRHKSHDLPKKPSLPIGIEKICKNHGPLTREEVYLNDKNAQYQCRLCKSEAMTRNKIKNPNRIVRRNFIHLGKGESRIAVPIDDYNKMAEAQNNLCAICYEPETMINASKTGTKRLAIDHCHSSKRIRGLLCHKCNVSLGSLKDSITILESAIAYLKAHE